MSPHCCTASQEYRTVTLFVPASPKAEASWSVPYRGDDNELAKGGVTNAKFCPFCGAKLGREHLSFMVAR